MQWNSAMNLNNASQLFPVAPRASEDLRLALGQQGLAELVRSAIPSNPERASESSERLLALLTYSYAAGVFDSAEIPREMDRNDLMQFLGTEMPFDHHVLRQFRRHHRSQLRDCLSRVLRSVRLAADTTYAGRSMNRWSMGANDGCDEEAEERIDRAVRADTFASDD
jgi:hypothetical protein